MYSVSAATKLISQVRDDDAYFGLDDVIVSGILAERAGVPRVCLSTAYFGYSGLELNQCWRHPPLIILAAGGFESVKYALDEVNSGMTKCNETNRVLW
ncbi:unnamed protein product [Anisakis simplex]|uniref:Glycosyltransferase family 1 protein n=1 Tax=Anisakis simplex TaxID=6269 RepID=A0A0M3K277_ANISI|nr:unnamed protein product [Anisakis simplex]